MGGRRFVARRAGLGSTWIGWWRWTPLVDMQILKRLGAALKEGLGTISPTCRDAVRLQSAILDQPVPFPKRMGLGLHLLLCKWCRRYGRQLRFLRQAAHEHPDQLADAAPQSLSPEAGERLKQSLREPG